MQFWATASALTQHQTYWGCSLTWPIKMPKNKPLLWGFLCVFEGTSQHHLFKRGNIHQQKNIPQYLRSGCVWWHLNILKWSGARPIGLIALFEENYTAHTKLQELLWRGIRKWMNNWLVVEGRHFGLMSRAGTIFLWQLRALSSCKSCLNSGSWQLPENGSSALRTPDSYCIAHNLQTNKY